MTFARCRLFASHIHFKAFSTFRSHRISNPFLYQQLGKQCLFFVATTAGSFWVLHQYLSPILEKSPSRKKSLRLPENEWDKVVYKIQDQVSQLKPPERAMYALLGLNTLVFLCWRIPRLEPFMRRHFVHDPLTGKSLTLLTSGFSHQNVFHFAFNMMALNSFGYMIYHVMGNSASFHHFYLTALLSSSLASHSISLLLLKFFNRPIYPGLGASGAIWGLLGCAAYCFPSASIHIAFLPHFHFEMQHLVPVLMGVDLLGLFLGWRALDHVAHLGGAMVGLSYGYYIKHVKNRQ